jgi:hypothetical protein
MATLSELAREMGLDGGLEERPGGMVYRPRP